MFAAAVTVDMRHALLHTVLLAAIAAADVGQLLL
jgi:hypothetical protein